MREFLTVIWNAFKYTIVQVFSMAVLGITIVIACIGCLFATLYWPFYPYDQLNSLVIESQKNQPNELRFVLGSQEKAEQENSILMSGKLYCGAKLINQHIALKDFTYESIKTDKDRENLAAIYQNADKYLCPVATQVASSR
jgi:hypothetical protein